MSERRRIPLLKDHHSHPSVYAAMAAGLDLRFVTEKQEALKLMRVRQEGILLVQGWNNSLYLFDHGELNGLPPLFICNTSLHSFLVNDSDRLQLESTHAEEVRNIKNQDWIERNLPTLFKLIVEVQVPGKGPG